MVETIDTSMIEFAGSVCLDCDLSLWLLSPSHWDWL